MEFPAQSAPAAKDTLTGFKATAEATKKATAWANTPQQKTAYQLAQAASIEILTRSDLRVGGSRKRRAGADAGARTKNGLP
jgi:hypothetical protein